MKNKGNKNPLPSSDVRGIQITSHEKKRVGQLLFIALEERGETRAQNLGAGEMGLEVSRRLDISLPDDCGHR